MLAITSYMIGLNNEIQLTNIMIHLDFQMKLSGGCQTKGNQQMTTASNGMRLIPELSGEIFFLF